MSLVRVQFEEPFLHLQQRSCLMDSWGIAKSVKARDFDSSIRWFESNYPRQFILFFSGLRGADKGSLAQLVEQGTENPRVSGSIPL